MSKILYTHIVCMFTCIYGESEDMLYTEKHIYMSIYVCAYTYIHTGKWGHDAFGWRLIEKHVSTPSEKYF